MSGNFVTPDVSMSHRAIEVAPGHWVSVVTTGIFSNKETAEMTGSAILSCVEQDMKKLCRNSAANDGDDDE